MPPDLRLLLDQGFPHPTGFVVGSIDRTVEVVHLSQFDPTLSAASTPDWALYCIAAAEGFDALVTRDASQLEQATEMYVLSRLHDFVVITWRQPIEDPIREWGQLLAYLPAIKQRLLGVPRRGIVIRLPAPRLGGDNVWRPEERLGREAWALGRSQDEVRADARREIEAWCVQRLGDRGAFDQLLRHRPRR
ncbi:MAG: hypothetical protein ACRDY3_12550 [Acidimicrobiales bacterium]